MCYRCKMLYAIRHIYIYMHTYIYVYMHVYVYNKQVSKQGVKTHCPAREPTVCEGLPPGGRRLQRLYLLYRYVNMCIYIYITYTR